ncbi:MAG TPA: hypothetical protein VM537_15880 [Anaerolineae bacterium]|nr:hypothetical protein [Anaerolineae bacterium]
MWVQLLSRKSIIVKGKMTHYEPGDWVTVGKHQAKRWIAAGEAMIVQAQTKKLLSGSAGVLLTRGHASRLDGLASTGIEVMTGAARLPWLRTLIMDPGASLQENQILAGLGLLDPWQVAIPLKPYNLLAENVGSEAERAQTRAVIHDLRVLVYDHRCVFARRCPETEQLIHQWQDEGGGILALLRAIYIVKPLVLALPASWTSTGTQE